MSSFRKRKNPVTKSFQNDFRIVNRKVGEEEYVSCEVPQKVEDLPSCSPSLDEMLKAGVAVKEVKVDGILDSYDENDTPIAEVEEKIVKSKKTKKSE